MRKGKYGKYKKKTIGKVIKELLAKAENRKNEDFFSMEKLAKEYLQIDRRISFKTWFKRRRK